MLQVGSRDSEEEGRSKTPSEPEFFREEEDIDDREDKGECFIALSSFSKMMFARRISPCATPFSWMRKRAFLAAKAVASHLL